MKNSIPKAHLPEISPIELLRQSYGQWEQISGEPLKELLSIEYIRFLIQFHKGIETHIIRNGQGIYYTVDDATSKIICGAAQQVPEAAEVVRQIIASNVFESAPLTYDMRCVASQMIRGSFPAKTRRGGPVQSNFLQRWFLFSSAVTLSDAFGNLVPLTRNDASPEHSACDFVVSVAAEFGIGLNYTAIRDWCTSKKHEQFRLRAKSLSNYFKDLYLSELGVISNNRVFGPFAEMARMQQKLN